MKRFVEFLKRVQFARYITVGAVAGATDLLVNAILAEGMGVHPLWANAVSRPLGGAVSFTLNKFWTFGNLGKARAHVQAVRFVMVWCACFFLSQALIGFYFQVLHIRPLLSKISGEATLGVFSFLVQKFWTFR